MSLDNLPDVLPAHYVAMVDEIADWMQPILLAELDKVRQGIWPRAAWNLEGIGSQDESLLRSIENWRRDRSPVLGVGLRMFAATWSDLPGYQQGWHI